MSFWVVTSLDGEFYACGQHLHGNLMASMMLLDLKEATVRQTTWAALDVRAIMRRNDQMGRRSTNKGSTRYHGPPKEKP